MIAFITMQAFNKKYINECRYFFSIEMQNGIQASSAYKIILEI